MNLFRFLPYIHLFGRGCLCTTVYMWRWEDNLQKSVLSPHHVGSGGQTQVVRPGGKCLYPLNRLINPEFFKLPCFKCRLHWKWFKSSMELFSYAFDFIPQNPDECDNDIECLREAAISTTSFYFISGLSVFSEDKCSVGTTHTFYLSGKQGFNHLA